MRFDLTVRDWSGPDRDVAVDAPPDARVADLLTADAALAAATTSGERFWVGARLLRTDELIAGGRLRTGAVLSVGRPGPDAEPSDAVRSLDVVCGPDAGRTVPLEPGLIAVGRAPECGLVLTDPAVSRHHLEIAVTSRGVTVRDLTSTHGAEVDGRPLDRDGVDLAPGALICLGDTVLAVSDPASASAPHGPRLPPPEATVIDVPCRRRDGRPQRVAVVAALMPALAGAGLALAMHSTQFLALTLLSPEIALASAAGDRVHWRREHRRAARLHRRRTAAAGVVIADALGAELARRRVDHADPAALARLAHLAASRLWGRGQDDPKGLTVRLGVGAADSLLQVRRGDQVTPAARLSGVPLVADLGRGPLGVVAPRTAGLATARWVVCQVAVYHSPADVRLVLLLSEQAAAAWSWARWLPHLVTVAIGSEAHRETLAVLAACDASESRSTAPGIVVVVDRLGSSDPVPGLDALTASGSVTAVVLTGDDATLPQDCVTVSRTDGETAGRLRLEDAAGTTIGDAIADRVEAGWAERVARTLAPLSSPAASGPSTPPAACRLADLLELRDEPAEVRWRGADGGAATVIGAGAEGSVTLDLVRDGPHALVAGTTGSGKSEFLQSLVVGLALAYPPDELTFVLVDYKGGAAFGRCAQLPHVVGLVTDLDRGLTARALASLDAELRRRERLFAAVGAADLAAYRAASPADGVPRLVLVVDEFAALVEELPDLLTGLTGLAQRGRSLGLHLVLATQRPGGAVTPEIKANAAVRIALRVVDPADSLDVVGVDTAAGFSRGNPGRAVLRAGDTLCAVQTGYVGGPSPRRGPQPLTVRPLDLWRRPRPGAQSGHAPVTDLDDIVAELCAAAERSGRVPARRPWLPPLPAAIGLDELGRGPATAVRIGRIDRPDRQDQPPFDLDLASGGFLLVAGTPRSGRTTTLLAVAAAAARGFCPEAVRLHVVDPEGGLAALTRLPHTATTLGRADLDLVDDLLDQLEHEIRRRRSAAAPGEPFHVLLIDRWDTVLANADDGTGRLTDRLASLVSGAHGTGVTAVVTGDRTCLTPRLSAAASTRLLLRLADPADYTALGVPPHAVPGATPAGRAVRSPDGRHIQLAHPGRSADPAVVAAELRRVAQLYGPGPAYGLRVRPLPSTVRLAELTGSADRPTLTAAVLGVGGAAARPVVVNLVDGSGQLLVAGPARSGRSTVLLCLLRQAAAAGLPTAVAAPERSPLRQAAAGVATVLDARDPWPAGTHPRLLLVDDWETVAETPLGATFDAATRTSVGVSPPAVVVAGRTDDLLLAYRGLAADLRRARHALLLAPGPGDGDLVGARLPRSANTLTPGRGFLFGDPAWGPDVAPGPLSIQVALP